MDANKYRTAYDKAQAVQHEVWTELCQHLEHAPDAQLLSDYTATLVYTLDKDRRVEALRLLRGQLYSRQLRDTGRVESWFTDCGARMGQDIEGFVANARQQPCSTLSGKTEIRTKPKATSGSLPCSKAARS